MSEYEVLLKAKKINKSFSGIQVLDNVELEIRKGEVHALMGENGAGKSTLIKIISGAYQRDSGEIVFNGNNIDLDFNRHKAQEIGISVIYQELSLIPSLTVAQNIYLGCEPVSKFTGVINSKWVNESAKKLIEKYNFPLDPYSIVENLSIAQRQLVEILKALSNECSLIIMDEPTASLSAREVDHLFDIIGQLKKKNVSILYISHRIEEIYRVADRITVLRDGKYAGVLGKSENNPEKIINLMIGRKIENDAQRPQLKRIEGEKILEVRNLSIEGKLEDISFELIKGEVLGISGLVGSGRTELVRAIFGADKFDKGEIYLEGSKYTPQILDSIKKGFGFVPEDRRLHGFIPEQSVAKNIGITNFDKIGNKIRVVNSRELNLAREVIKKINIKPNTPFINVINMSGGNQQKVVLGKWLIRDLKVLIIDEPTAGVDVGAKEEIYGLIDNITAQGVAVIIVSSDLPELVKLSDRIIVIRQGKIVKEFYEGFITEEEVLKASSGVAAHGGIA